MASGGFRQMPAVNERFWVLPNLGAEIQCIERQLKTHQTKWKARETKQFEEKMLA